MTPTQCTEARRPTRTRARLVACTSRSVTVLRCLVDPHAQRQSSKRFGTWRIHRGRVSVARARPLWRGRCARARLAAARRTRTRARLVQVPSFQQLRARAHLAAGRALNAPVLGSLSDTEPAASLILVRLKSRARFHLELRRHNDRLPEL